MNQARRALSYWILATLVERGFGTAKALRRHRRQPVRSVRPLTSRELQELGRPVFKVCFLHRPRATRAGG